MRGIAFVTAFAIVAGSLTSAAAAPISGARIENATPIVLVQEKKTESTTEKVKRSVKRTWKNMTGYKFEVACLFSRTTCTETGDSRAAARAKCSAQHPFCAINDAK